MPLIRILRIRTQRVLLPTVQLLPALVQPGKLFPESPECLVRVKIHALPYPVPVSFLITGIPDRKILPSVVHIGIKNLLPGQGLSVKKDGHFPISLPTTKGQPLCSIFIIIPALFQLCFPFIREIKNRIAFFF